MAHIERWTLEKESELGPNMVGDPKGDWCEWTEASNRITALEEALRVLAKRIRVGCDFGTFMREEYPVAGKDKKAMNRKRARFKNALFIACDELDANPIAAEAVRKAGG
jgi:hypothetical protein